MSVHSLTYAVRSRGAKQDTEDKVEINIRAYFLQSLDRDPERILKCACVVSWERQRLSVQAHFRGSAKNPPRFSAADVFQSVAAVGRYGYSATAEASSS